MLAQLQYWLYEQLGVRCSVWPERCMDRASVRPSLHTSHLTRHTPQGLHMENEAQTSSVDLSTNDLAARITELAGHLNAANHRWLMLMAEFDRRDGWSG